MVFKLILNDEKNKKIGELMTNNNLILNDELFKSKEFKEWNESYISVINHALQPTKKFIKNWEAKHGKLPELEHIKDDDPWAIKTKEEIMTLRTDLIIKSIELGLYFRSMKKGKN